MGRLHLTASLEEEKWALGPQQRNETSAVHRPPPERNYNAEHCDREIRE